MGPQRSMDQSAAFQVVTAQQPGGLVREAGPAEGTSAVRAHTPSMPAVSRWQPQFMQLGADSLSGQKCQSELLGAELPCTPVAGCVLSATPHPISSHLLTQPSPQPVSSNKRKEGMAARFSGGEQVGWDHTSFLVLSGMGQPHFIAHD